MLVQIVKFADGAKLSRKLPKQQNVHITAPKDTTTFIVNKKSLLGSLFGEKKPKRLVIDGDGDIFIKAPVDVKSKAKGYVKVRDANTVKVKNALQANVEDSTGDVNITQTKKLAAAVGNRANVEMRHNEQDAIALYTGKNAMVRNNYGAGIVKYSGGHGTASGNKKGLAAHNGELNAATFNRILGVGIGDANSVVHSNGKNLTRRA